MSKSTPIPSGVAEPCWVTTQPTIRAIRNVGWVKTQLIGTETDHRVKIGSHAR